MKERFRFRGTPTRWLLLSAFLALGACSSNQVTTGLIDDRLRPCPNSPNCVSSDATDEVHRVEPYRLKAPAQEAWHGLQNVLAAEQGTRLVEANDSYLHVEVRSAILRFVDDTEFQLRASEGIIAVRSAARTGYNDTGVNRKRIERIRQALRARALIE